MLRDPCQSVYPNMGLPPGRIPNSQGDATPKGSRIVRASCGKMRGHIMRADGGRHPRSEGDDDGLAQLRASSALEEKGGKTSWMV
jgi:hypothetical protein